MSRETFPCLEVCPDLEDAARSLQCCSRADLPTVLWPIRTGGPEAIRGWMGRRPLRPGEDDPEVTNPREPEEPLSQGCPGAWYRCEFARSIHPFLPEIIGDTAIASPLLDRSAPRLIHQAVRYYNGERARCQMAQHEARQ